MESSRAAALAAVGPWQEVRVAAAAALLARAGAFAFAAFLPISIAGMQIGLAAALAGLVLARVAGAPPGRRALVDLPALLLAGACLASVLLAWGAGTPPASLFRATLWKTFLTPLVVAAALELPSPGEPADAPRRRALIALSAWAAGALVTGAVSAVQPWTGFDPLFWIHTTPLRITAERAAWPDHFHATGFFHHYAVLPLNLVPPLALAAAVAALGPRAARSALSPRLSKSPIPPLARLELPLSPPGREGQGEGARHPRVAESSPSPPPRLHLASPRVSRSPLSPPGGEGQGEGARHPRVAEPSPRLRLLLGAAAAASALASILSLTRTAVLSLGLVALVVALAGRRRTRLALAAAAALGLVAVAIVPGVRSRLASAATPAVNADRTLIWKVCDYVRRDHPWVGVGAGNFGSVAGPYFDRVDPAWPVRTGCHDAVLTSLVEGGPLVLAASALYWALLVAGFLGAGRDSARRGDALGRAAAVGGLAAIAATLAHALFHDVFDVSQSAYALGFALGCAAVLARPPRAPGAALVPSGGGRPPAAAPGASRT